MNNTNKKNNFKSFLILWIGQLISIIGSGNTSFALGIMVFSETKSATQFAMITLFAVLPGLLTGPLGGVIADRYNRKLIMFVSDLFASLSTIYILICILINNLDIYQICIATAINSIADSFQSPAYQGAVTQIVPKKLFQQAGSMNQLAHASRHVISPIIGSLLFAAVGIMGVIVIDFITFIIAAVVLLFIRIPSIHIDKTTETIEKSILIFQKSRKNILKEFLSGYKYLLDRPGLHGFLWMRNIPNIFQGFLVVLVGPMILSFASAQVLGVAQSVAGMGMVIFSIVTSFIGGPKRLIKGYSIFFIISSLGFMLMGIYPNAIIITIFAFVYFSGYPIYMSCFHTIWRKKIPIDHQGRLFSIYRMSSDATIIIGYILGGILADNVFNPLLIENGLLASTIGTIIGIGPGRGIGLMFICSGMLMIIICCVAYLNPKIRNLELDIPDAIVEENEIISA